MSSQPTVSDCKGRSGCGCLGVPDGHPPTAVENARWRPP